MIRLTRRRLIGSLGIGAGGLLVGGCDRLSRSPAFHSVLEGAEGLNKSVQRLVVDRAALAREYDPSDLSPVFRTNGNTMPGSAEYQEHLRSGFRHWRLKVDGLVERPLSLSLDQLMRLPRRSQITRHDCVEGWSAIGKWTGVPLGLLLRGARLKPEARYIVFHCADDFGGTPYYESVDLAGAYHPQTILAWGMNDRMLPTGHGAPLRLRLERQLGYKNAKFVMRVEAVDGVSHFGRGKGGYWEDVAHYQWYAGI